MANFAIFVSKMVHSVRITIKSCAAMVKIVAAILFSVAGQSLRAQTFDTEFNPVEGWGEVWSGEGAEREGDIFAPGSDPEIFATPTWGARDPFRDFSRYRFGGVRYRERGLDSRHFRVLLAGVDLTDNLSSYPDWNLITLARRAGLASEQLPAMVATTLPAGIGRSESYSLRPASSDLYILLRAGDRYARGGGDLRYSRITESGWSWIVAATGQYGDDGHLAGVYSDEAGGVVSTGKSWAGGASLTFFGAGGVSERGSRTAATREAFDLTGDNLYNPVWGLQEGRMRNSRTTRAEYLFGALELKVPLDARQTLSLTVATRRNRGGRTRLAWYDAHSPMPDYYRSMPSFFPDWEAADVIADAWREGDPTVTQIDWRSFYYNNTLSADGRATYIVERQVEDAHDLHALLTMEGRTNGGVDYSCGVRVRRDASRFYKLADDMLGAVWVPNVDQYVTDTDGEYHTAPPNENDLQNPGRRVERGERFGYDYRMTRLAPSAFGTVRMGGPGWGLTASMELTHTRLSREGYYEKELFPGAASLGRSNESAFTTYGLSAAAYIDVGVHHSFSLAAVAASEAPFVRNLFLSPQQNNLIAAGVSPSGLYGVEAAWAVTGRAADLRLGGFVNSTTGETQVRQYYDDLASTFADMVTRGVDRLGYGVEAGVEVRPARWLTFSAGGSVGEYRYNSEPTATLYEDSTGEVFSEGIICYMSGLHTGLPELAAGAELTFSDRRYLRVALSGEWLAGRWVEINPLFHSSRVAGINPAPEIMDLFTSQERLPDAFTLGASVSKGWVTGRGYLRVAASVRNLLSATIIHSGYEQMRIRRRGSGLDRTFEPFPAKYLYAYPATWSVTLSYRL
jgi:hypothetical protein